MTDKGEMEVKTEQEVKPDLYDGNWLIFIGRDGEELRKSAQRKLEALAEEQTGEQRIKIWSPSQNKSNLIGCSQDGASAADIYRLGRKIKDLLLFRRDMYFKLTEPGVNSYVSEFKLDRNGAFSRRQCDIRGKWDPLIEGEEEVADDVAEDDEHLGLWLYFVENITSEREAVPELRRALLDELSVFAFKGEIMLWESDRGSDARGPVGCVAVDDRNLNDVYQQGMRFYKALGDFATATDIYFKTSDAIKRRLLTKAGDMQICDYKITTHGEFFRRHPNDRGTWLPINVSQLE